MRCQNAFTSVRAAFTTWSLVGASPPSRPVSARSARRSRRRGHRTDRAHRRRRSIAGRFRGWPRSRTHVTREGERDAAAVTICSSTRRTGGPLIRRSDEATVPVVCGAWTPRTTASWSGLSGGYPVAVRDRRGAGRRGHRPRAADPSRRRPAAHVVPRTPVAARASTSGTSARARGSPSVTSSDSPTSTTSTASRSSRSAATSSSAWRRYDRWRHRAEAEVAFFVDDANHGRGLATLLLEHLAARAREVGLSGFTASVLPDNRRMIGVFTQAGFETATRFADGVVEVRLDLQPTPEAEAAIEARARTAAAQAVRRLLSPRSVAVIGAGRDPESMGHRVLRQLQLARFAGPIWPVNPNAHDVASIRAVPQHPRHRRGGRPRHRRRARRRGGGGGRGVRPQAGLRRGDPVGRLRRVGPRRRGARGRGAADGPLVGHPAGRARTASGSSTPTTTCGSTPSFADVPTRPGGLSLLSESGMLGAVLVTTAHEAGLGLSSFLALGNRADVSGNDLLQYWEADDTTEVVGMYIESFGNPRNFSRLARRLTRVKPVVAVKARRLVRRRRLDRGCHRGRAAPPDRCAARPHPLRARRHGAPAPRPAAARRAARRRAGQRRWVARHRRRRGARPRTSSWPTWQRRRSPRSPRH